MCVISSSQLISPLRVSTHIRPRLENTFNFCHLPVGHAAPMNSLCQAFRSGVSDQLTFQLVTLVCCLGFKESSVGLPAPCRVWRSFVFCLLSSSLACFVHLTTNGYFCSVGFVSLGFLRMRFLAPCPTLLLSHSGGLGTDIGGVTSSRKQSKLKC